MFTNISMNYHYSDNTKLVAISCYKNGLPYCIPNNLDNTDYQEILDEIIENGTTNFKTGETIPTALQQDVDNKKAA